MSTISPTAPDVLTKEKNRLVYSIWNLLSFPTSYFYQLWYVPFTKPAKETHIVQLSSSLNGAGKCLLTDWNIEHAIYWFIWIEQPVFTPLTVHELYFYSETNHVAISCTLNSSSSPFPSQRIWISGLLLIRVCFDNLQQDRMTLATCNVDHSWFLVSQWPSSHVNVELCFSPSFSK